MRLEQDSEVIFFQDELQEQSGGTFVPDDPDGANKARHYGNEQVWTIESYSPTLSRRMRDLGAIERKGVIEAGLFTVDARQLIEFIAAASGLHVEFRKHKKRQLSDETKAKLTERLARMREKVTA